MQYEVKLTLQAVEQIQEIVNYISCVLLEPETANYKKSRAKECINLKC